MNDLRRTITSTVKLPEYCIYYTSSDGKIVTPYSATTFGTDVSIVSNTYENGIGCIKLNKAPRILDNNAFSGRTTLTSIEIPETVGGIMEKAFYNCNKLTSITIPDSVITIGASAFTSCSSLTSIAIPDSVFSIGSYAFSGCSKLTGDLIIPDSVTKIGSYAFNGCSGLTSLVIGSGVTSIGSSAFSSCSGLTGDLVIPDSVTSIGGGAFSSCSGLTSLAIGTSVTSIGSQAFINCSRLTSLIIGSGVTSIGEYAFYNCRGLIGELVIPDSVTNIGDEAFSGCTGLTSLVIGSGVTSIGSGTFRGCSKLTGELIIPDSVISIGYNAFYQCTSLTSLVIGSGVTSIGSQAFYNCRGLIGELVIPDSVTSIGSQAFISCSRLTSLVIGRSVTSIGSNAFRSCEKLTSITSYSPCFTTIYDNKILVLNNNTIILAAPASLMDELVIPDNITSIGSQAFSSCSGLSSITIPDNVTSIGNGAFRESSLTSLVIGTGVTSIGSQAFNNCRGLIGELVIPDSVTSIGDEAFSDCPGLTSLIIGSGVTSIGNSAFKYCYGLTSLVIGSGVTSIGEYAFSYCYRLTSINFKSKYPPNTHVSAFDSINNREIKIPYNNFYKTWWHNNKISGTPIYPFTEKQYHDLNITSVGRVDDGKQTTVQVRYSCLFDGYDISNTYHTNIKEEDVLTSSEFPQNTSETSSVEREITIEYQGLTASTTITQGPMKPLPPKIYSVELNNQWELSTTITNPDNNVYEGVYQSYSNKGVPNSAAVMYIDIENYENFKFYIRSYAESSYDYVMVSQLDKTITSGSSYSDTTLVKAHTCGKQSSTTSISGYTLVEFTEIPEGKHRITVLYRKDSSANSGDDRGYVLIPKEQ